MDNLPQDNVRTKHALDSIDRVERSSHFARDPQPGAIRSHLPSNRVGLAPMRDKGVDDE